MSRVKLLNVVTPDGHSGELSKGSQFSFAYSSSAACPCIRCHHHDRVSELQSQVRSFPDRTLAIKLNKAKAYPDRQQLMEFGRKHCAVEKPGVIIEQIAEAMSEALITHQARIDAELFSAMQAEWDGGRAMALHTSVGTGMKRKPVAKKPL